MYRTPRLKSLHWHKLLRSLMLPLLLLVAQQGAVLHELSHDAAAASHEGKKQSPRSDACELCLAFAQVGSAPVPHGVAAPVPADLSHRLTPVFAPHGEGIQLPAERSRGPPLFL